MGGWWNKHVVPRLIGCCCSQPNVMALRAHIVPQASGRVLELGAGGGANFRLYDPSRIASLDGIDPSPELISLAHERCRHSPLQCSLCEGIAEELPYPDHQFDTVVSTFTLCSVQDPVRALQEARRVMKPDGRLLFVEHGASPDAGPAAWQRRLEPVWKRIAGNCHLTRNVLAELEAAGFATESSEAAYMPQAPRWVGWVRWGIARPR